MAVSLIGTMETEKCRSSSLAQSRSVQCDGMKCAHAGGPDLSEYGERPDSFLGYITRMLGYLRMFRGWAMLWLMRWQSGIAGFELLLDLGMQGGRLAKERIWDYGISRSFA